MKIQFNLSYWFLSTATVVVAVCALAWAGNPRNSSAVIMSADTIPSSQKTGREAAGKDLDKEIYELDEARKHLEELKNKDWPKMQRDIEESIRKIDFEKIRIQAEEAIKKVDLEKIGKEIEESLRKIDFDKIEREIQTSLDEVSKIDREKIKQEIQKARVEIDEQLQKKEWRKELEEIKKINKKEIEVELENAKRELGRVKADLHQEKINLGETMNKARLEVDRAKVELQGYQEMIYSMEKEGLLDTGENYTIEYKHGELFVNGKKQTSDITGKYKKVFKNDRITIKKINGDLEINKD